MRNLDEEHTHSRGRSPQRGSGRTSASASGNSEPGDGGDGGGAAPLSMGWLLRLFRSDFFDAWMAVTYLYRYRASRGVHDYLCNELYHLSDSDLEAFLPQVCNLLVHHARDSPALERFVMDKCATSLHFAAQVYWFLQAAVEDAVRESNKEAESRCRLLRTRCETAAVNGVQGPLSSSSPSMALAAAAAAAAAAASTGTQAMGRREAAHKSQNSASDRTTGKLASRRAGDSKEPTPLVEPSSGSASNTDGVAQGGSTPRTTTNTEANDAESSALRPPAAPSSLIASKLLPLPKPMVQRTDVSKSISKASLDRAQASNTSETRTDDIPAKEPAVTDNVASSTNSRAPLTREGIPDRARKPDDDSLSATGSGAAMRRKGIASASSASLDDVAKAGAAMATSPGAPQGQPSTAASNGDDDDHPAPSIASDAATLGDSEDLRADEEDVYDDTQDLSSSVTDGPTDAADSTDIVEEERLAKLGNALKDASLSPAPLLERLEAPSVTSAELESVPEPTADAQSEASFDPTALLMKKERHEYFNDILTVVKAFVSLSLSLRDVPNDNRLAELKQGLESVNDVLLRRMSGEITTPLGAESTPTPSADEVAALGEYAAMRSIHLPLSRATSPVQRILRVLADDAIILTSRTRVPYMLFVEVLPTDMLCCDQLLFCQHIVQDLRRQGYDVPLTSLSSAEQEKSPDKARGDRPSADTGANTSRAQSTTTGPGSSSSSMLGETPEERQRASVHEAIYGSSTHLSPFVELDMLTHGPPPSMSSTSMGSSSLTGLGAPDGTKKSRDAALLAVYGEMWSARQERMLQGSPFRLCKGLKIMPFIVKAGDDLRQEQLAIQLISQFEWIFKEENVDVFLRPFIVMSVSSDAGFVEVITDAVSVHSLKKRTPNFVSLLDYFERAYGKIGSRSFREAQRRFIQSMAGYSLVSYFLQIKDRHNGNIMLDAQGHIIHIDFGFMLTNSPGAIKFENVPFKLTEEYLQVICARKSVLDAAETARSEGYRYFQELFVLGLLAARKHYEKLTTLVEIMMEGTSMPCMSGGHSVVESLRHRFCLGVSEQQCITNALALIEESRLSWRSASYDKFQNMQNGYL